MNDETAETIPVVAAVIRREGRYLVCRRPSHKRHGGMWEFPGGKVQEGETLTEAVARELDEELSLTAVDVGLAPVFQARDPGSSFLILFLETVAGGDPVAHEHDALGWMSPEELQQLPLAPSDERFVREVLRGTAGD